MTRLWIWECYLSLLLSPASKNWILQSCLPLESLFSPLSHLQTADVNMICLYFLLWLCYSVVPGCIQKAPYCCHSPHFHCFRQELVLSLRLCHQFWSFLALLLRSGSVSIFSRPLPVFYSDLSALFHVLWLRLQVSSSFVEGNFYLYFILGVNFFLIEKFILYFKTGHHFFLLPHFNKKKEEEEEEEKEKPIFLTTITFF